MHCPRLDHFVRLNASGKIGKCGHMINAPEFDSIEKMMDSEWLQKVKNQMHDDIWPNECLRCKTTEDTNGRSIRLDMIERDKILGGFDKNYIIVGGVLDNVCNSACQTCNASLSSKIGSITKNPIKINNLENFYKLPLDKIYELDINGGEPTYSQNYKKILSDPPPNVKIIRINTNGHRPFDEIENLLKKDIKVIVTMSFDGLGKVHDYTRWPICFEVFKKTLDTYVKLSQTHKKNFRLNTWTTVSVFNIGQMEDIINFTKQHNIDHSYALLENPSILSVYNINKLTIDAKLKFMNHKNAEIRNLSKKIAIGKNNSANLCKFIEQQDSFRKISFNDYFNLWPQDL